MITARTTLYKYEPDLTTSATTSLDTIPPVNWAEFDKREDKKRKKWLKRGNNIHLNERRKDIFR